jgi:hypothetical protein
MSTHGLRPAGPAASAPSAASPPPKPLCPAGTLPDEGVCIPVPAPRAAAESPRSTSVADRIPRRPDRSARYARYRLPTGGSVSEGAGGLARDGGPPLLGILLGAPFGAPVVAMPLDGQDGPSVVVYVGPLVGSTVVTHRAVITGGRRSEYLVVTGNLTFTAALAARHELAAGAVIGKAGGVPVYFETRLLRPGIDVWSLAPNDLLGDAASVSVDPRNVIPRAE